MLLDMGPCLSFDNIGYLCMPLPSLPHVDGVFLFFFLLFLSSILLVLFCSILRSFYSTYDYR